jgi:mannose-6-phosphate isomerase
MLSHRADVRALLDELGEVKVTQTDKPWGVEWTLMLGELVVKVIRVNEGAQTSLQKHEIKDEVHYILEGDGTIEGTADNLHTFGPRPSPGYRVLPGHVHRAIGDLLMLELSTNDLDDVVRIEDDYGRGES